MDQVQKTVVLFSTDTHGSIFFVNKFIVWSIFYRWTYSAYVTTAKHFLEHGCVQSFPQTPHWNEPLTTATWLWWRTLYLFARVFAGRFKGDVVCCFPCTSHATPGGNKKQKTNKKTHHVLIRQVKIFVSQSWVSSTSSSGIIQILDVI